MLSRVANSIYWMSRYIERAENVARFLDVVRHLVLDLPGERGNQWESLIYASGDHETFLERYGEPTEAKVTQFLTFDRDNPNSMYSSLWLARENARSIREIISSEMWEQVNRSYHLLREAEASNRVGSDPSTFYNEFKKACHLFLGLADTTMTHNEAWHFARMARLLERGDKTSRILDVKYFMLLPRVDYVGSPYDTLQWSALLRCISALEMYRKRFHQIMPRPVAEFLVLDRDFPRSMRFCLIRAEESMHHITGARSSTFTNPAEQKLGRLRAELDFADIEEIFAHGLHEYLDAYQTKLNDLGSSIHNCFFGIRHNGDDEPAHPSMAQTQVAGGVA